VLAGDGVAIAVIGVSGLVVVQSANGVVVVPRERAQEVRAAVAALQTRNLDEYL
jgi:regulator of RNase E activity RraA